MKHLVLWCLFLGPYKLQILPIVLLLSTDIYMFIHKHSKIGQKPLIIETNNQFVEFDQYKFQFSFGFARQHAHGAIKHRFIKITG